MDTNFSIHGLSFAEISFINECLTEFRNGDDSSEPAETPVWQPGAIAPQVTAQPTQHQPAAGELDKAGVPWHAGIHSASKKQTANGKWALKRGVDHTAAEAYIAQFRGAGNAAPISAPIAPVSAPTAPQLNHQFAAPSVPQYVTIPAAQPSPVPAAPTYHPVDYGAWYQLFTHLYQDGRGPLGDQAIAEMHHMSGVTGSDQYMNNDAGRAASYAYMMQFGKNAGLIQ